MRRMTGSSAIAAALALAALATIRAQTPARADADYLLHAFDTFQQMQRASPYQALPWQFIGPTNISGRVADIAVADTAAGRAIYVAGATGGIWKSTDHGASWTPIFEHQATASLGDLAVAPSNPDIVWAGTGEANIFRASLAGTGVYRSSDAGRTWQHMGLTDTHTIARIVVHPTNPDVVYVAAAGHEWTDNEMRGVFKTTDGGRTWKKVLYRSPRTGAIDLLMDPSDPATLYAAMWQRVRRKWSDPRVEPGYGEGGIWKTTDAGATWTEADLGLSSPPLRGRIGLDISRSNPSVLYALVDSYDQGRPARPNENDAYGRPLPPGKGIIRGMEIYRTDDKAGTWHRVSGQTPQTAQQMMGLTNTYGWVFAQIRVDPADVDTVYALGLSVNVSHDGGATFARMNASHGDNHALWIDPKNPKILYNGNDGGFTMSEDGGQSWTAATAIHLTQFYNVELDPATPFHAWGSAQDFGSYRVGVDLAGGRDRLQPLAWQAISGGEGTNFAVDPTDPDVYYAHSYYGHFSRTDLSPEPGAGAGGRGRGGVSRGSSTSIVPPVAAGDPVLRGQWMAPIIVSVFDHRTIYAGYQYVFRSRDEGDTWDRISGDLTGNKTAQMGENPSAIPYQTIVALAESPKQAGLLYAGTDDGRLHVTRDDGRTWTDLTSNLPQRKWISRVVPSAFDEGTVYVTQRGREDDDFAPYVYKSTDFGRTFTGLTANLPAGPVNVIREDPRNASTLYLGTDFGAFLSTNGGGRWDVLGSLPTVEVADLQIHPRDLIIVAATYGRGMFAMDARLVGGGR